MNRRELLQYLMAGGAIAASGLYVPKLISIPSGKVFTKGFGLAPVHTEGPIVVARNCRSSLWNEDLLRKVYYEWKELTIKEPRPHGSLTARAYTAPRLL